MPNASGEPALGRRSLALFLVLAGLGPFVAGVVFILWFSAFALVLGENPGSSLSLFGGLPGVVQVSYKFGWPAAAITGLVIGLLVRRPPSRRVHLLFAFVVGTIATLIAMPLMALLMTGRLNIAGSAVLFIILALVGGVAALACTALVRFWPVDRNAELG